MRNAMVVITLALCLSACAPQPKPPLTPTSESISTLSTTPQPTLTAAVISSPQATQAITVTPAPSATLMPTPTFPPSFFFSLPTLTITPTPARPLDCSVVMQSVADGTTFSPGERFSISWQVVNTGSASWFPGNVVFNYIAGTKMYLYPETQLKAAVTPGETVGLNADMKAPKNSTTYSTAWSLRQGSTFFCRVSVSIFVGK